MQLTKLPWYSSPYDVSVKVDISFLENSGRCELRGYTSNTFFVVFSCQHVYKVGGTHLLRNYRSHIFLRVVNAEHIGEHLCVKSYYASIVFMSYSCPNLIKSQILYWYRSPYDLSKSKYLPHTHSTPGY